MLRFIKYTLGTAFVVVCAGLLLLGTSFTSYVQTSARSVQDSVKESVPLEFELRRAKDMIDAILPELQGQVRVIAQEEVAIASLEKDLDESHLRLDGEKKTLATMRRKMRNPQVLISVGDQDLSRQQLTEQIHQRLERFKQGQLAVESKAKLLEKRRQGLGAALTNLEKMRNRKVELEQKVEALIAQNRLLKASQIEAGVSIDGSQLSEADHLLDQIETRLAVAQRVLAHERDAFAIPLDDDVLEESDVLAAYDKHFSDSSTDETMVRLNQTAP